MARSSWERPPSLLPPKASASRSSACTRTNTCSTHGQVCCRLWDRQGALDRTLEDSSQAHMKAPGRQVKSCFWE